MIVFKEAFAKPVNLVFKTGKVDVGCVGISEVN